MNKYLKYSHPAATKFDVNKTYLLDELLSCLSLEQIKILFTPIGWNWDEKPKRKNEIVKY